MGTGSVQISFDDGHRSSAYVSTRDDESPYVIVEIGPVELTLDLVQAAELADVVTAALAEHAEATR